ncbi:hypothetical protein BSKO_02839 [Bryopsis sp. KO-2023]|nr:hypothetical protein BSKO_02839 [Bryopsis sp. KO-2023]
MGNLVSNILGDLVNSILGKLVSSIFGRARPFHRGIEMGLTGGASVSDLRPSSNQAIGTVLFSVKKLEDFDQNDDIFERPDVCWNGVLRFVDEMLVSGDEESGVVRVWDVPKLTEKALRKIPQKVVDVADVGKHVAVCGCHGYLVLWKKEDWSESQVLQIGDKQIESFTYFEGLFYFGLHGAATDLHMKCQKGWCSSENENDNDYIPSSEDESSDEEEEEETVLEDDISDEDESSEGEGSHAADQEEVGSDGYEADDEGEEEDRSVGVVSRKRSRDSGSEGDEGAEIKRSRYQ